jgi:hypothetical protein
MQTQKRDMPAGNGSGGGKFLKVEVGQSVTGVFRGEFVSYWQKWPKGGNKETSDVEKPGFQERFKVNFVVFEDGAFVAKILDCNLFLYNQIADINESLDIETIKCKVTRQATGKGSTYFAMPVLKEPIPAKALKAIEAVELNSLGLSVAPQQQATGTEGENVPF